MDTRWDGQRTVFLNKCNFDWFLKDSQLHKAPIIVVLVQIELLDEKFVKRIT